MRRLLKKLLNYWEKKREKKALLKKYGFKIVYKRSTSIILGCFGQTPPKNGKVDLLDHNGNVLKKDIPEEDAAKYMKEYEDAAKKQYSDLPAEDATKRYLDDIALGRPYLDGKFWKATNNFGTEVKWVNQTSSNKLGIKISKLIDDAISSSKPDKAFEGLVAKFVSDLEKQMGKIDNFGNKISRNLGELDITTKKYLIECKKALSGKTISNKNRKTEFLEQFRRYTDKTHKNYINIENKKVILIIDELTDGLKHTNPVFKELEDMGVTILTDYKQLINFK